jgi:hypothetical protein
MDMVQAVSSIGLPRPSPSTGKLRKADEAAVASAGAGLRRLSWDDSCHGTGTGTGSGRSGSPARDRHAATRKSIDDDTPGSDQARGMHIIRHGHGFDASCSWCAMHGIGTS